MSRKDRKTIAEQTVAVLESGSYVSPTGITVSIRDALDNARDNTRLLRPDDFGALSVPTERFETKMEVFNETTFAGAKSLLDAGASEACGLNFASAKHPGGGFLGGSQAQEEALARASGLYECLLQTPEYYKFHLAQRSAVYSDHMIYSPNVPVFRDDTDHLLEDPWQVSLITSPAVNRGALEKNSPDLLSSVPDLMLGRISRVLRLAAAFGHRNLVLGAWGCGVFRNDPNEMAGYFRTVLESVELEGVFENVRFSVLDLADSKLTFNAFDRQFAQK